MMGDRLLSSIRRIETKNASQYNTIKESGDRLLSSIRRIETEQLSVLWEYLKL